MSGNDGDSQGITQLSEEKYFKTEQNPMDN